MRNPRTASPTRVPPTAPTMLPADKLEAPDVERGPALAVVAGVSLSVPVGVTSVNEVVGVN